MHRDIKPANLMHLARDAAKILDFGIASYAEATAHLSSTGVIMGSSPFMPPEQWMGEKATPRSDMYAFGVTLHALLTGVLPFPGPTFAAWMRQHLDVEPPHIAGVPEQLDNLVQQLLAKDPAMRPSAAQAGLVLAGVRDRRPAAYTPTRREPGPVAPVLENPHERPGEPETRRSPATWKWPKPRAEQESTPPDKSAMASAPREPVMWGGAGFGAAFMAVAVVMAVNTKPDGSDGLGDIVVAVAIEVSVLLFGLLGVLVSFSGPLSWRKSVGVDSGGVTVVVRWGASRAQTRIPWTDIARISIVNAQRHGKEMRKRGPLDKPTEAIVIQRTPGATEPAVAVVGTFGARVKRLIMPRAFDTIDGFDVADCHLLAVGADVSADTVGWDSVSGLLRESHLYCDETAFWNAVRRR
ncbi:hypothetical protein GCM10025734_66390 [Kitasatospora paranensis]